MFKKVLAVTDLSSTSDEMIEQIAGLTSLGTEEVFLLRCFNPREIGGMEDQLKEEAKKPLQRQQERLEQFGFQVQTQIVFGAPQHEAERLSEEADCSLVVVGEQRHTLAGEILFDETAGSISHHAKRPVLVLRVHSPNAGTDANQPRASGQNDLLQHILLPTDFSQNAEQAMALLDPKKMSGIRKVTLLHVQNTLYMHDLELDQQTLDQITVRDQQKLEEMRQNLLASGIPEVTTDLQHGASPKHVILRRLENNDVSLVLLGTQGRGWFSELLLGSVSHAVARHSEVPTLLVPMGKA